MLTIAKKNDISRRLKALEEENIRLRSALEERKIIERAKGILMKREGISEGDAHKKIQKLSMDRRKKMVEIAEAIIIAEEARE